MFEELDKVVLTHDIKEYNLKDGDRGTIVHVYGKDEAYEVEFFNEKGKTIAVLTLMQDDIRAYINKDAFPLFYTPISLGTVSGMTLDTKVNNDELRITTENKEEFRYSIATL